MVGHEDPEDRLRDLEGRVIKFEYRLAAVDRDLQDLKEVIIDVRNLLMEVVKLQANQQVITSNQSVGDNNIKQLKLDLEYNHRSINTRVDTVQGFMDQMKGGLKTMGLALLLVQSGLGYYIYTNKEAIVSIQAAVERMAPIVSKVAVVERSLEYIYDMERKPNK